MIALNKQDKKYPKAKAIKISRDKKNVKELSFSDRLKGAFGKSKSAPKEKKSLNSN